MFAPIETRRAADAIIEQVRGQVAEGALVPGDRLPPERELAAAFGVSRNTVREALRSLENTGLLTLKKGAAGGAFIANDVAPAIVSGFADLFAFGVIRPEHLAEARLLVATTSARLACERASDADLADLAACVDDALAAGSAGDMTARSEANLRFHRLLAEASGNPILAVLADAITGINRGFAEAAGPPPNRQILPSRKRLMACLLARDADGAAREIAEQVKAVERFYMKELGGERRPAPKHPAGRAKKKGER